MASITWGVLLCAAAAALATATDLDFPRSGRIVGGQSVSIEKHPSIVQLEFLYANSFFWSLACGGNIITSRHLLSAAHCFEGRDYPGLPNTRLRAGATTTGSGGEIRYFTREIKHPSYNPSFTGSMDGDIVLLHLASPLTWTNSIQPATIIAQGTVLPANLPVVHAGWGRLAENGWLPNNLQDVTIYTVDHALCTRRYWEDRAIVTNNMICAGILDVGGKDACQGDSGGPLYYNDILVGIVSWGIGCARAYHPGVSAAISPYTNWIVANAV